MSSDDEKPPDSGANVFDIGERTILQLRNQGFDPDGLGSKIGASPGDEENPTALDPDEVAPDTDTAERPISFTTVHSEAIPAAAMSSGGAQAESIARLEGKIDDILQALENLQRHVDSIDAMMARALNR